MTAPCDKTEVIDMIRDDVAEIKDDVKTLLEYKNKLLGFTIGFTGLISLFLNLIIYMIKK